MGFNRTNQIVKSLRSLRKKTLYRKGIEYCMEDYRVIIAGCRNFYNYVTLKERCEYYLQNKMKTHNVIIVSGHAPGADSLGEKFAADHNLQCELHPADWKHHGKAAGPIRNEEMAEIADALIAFWDGQSRGTKSMIGLAKRKGLKVEVVRFDL